MPDIHAIILTKDEEIYLARCLASVSELCATITVVDCGSTDRTIEIARSFGVGVVTNPWVNYATQMNFGIDQVAARGGWVLRIDADEYLCDDATARLLRILDTLPADVDGVCLRLRRIFMGRWLKRGGLYPIWLLRLWRNGRGRCEAKWMDEHIVVLGKVHHAPVDFADHSLKPLAWWSQKHIGYAGREAIDILMQDARARSEAQGRAGQSGIKHWIKRRIYNRLPFGLRSYLYFVLRYIVQLGFLDGREGYYFHTLQGLWYRTLVDAIVAEIRRDVALGKPLAEAILGHTEQRVAHLAEDKPDASVT